MCECKLRKLKNRILQTICAKCSKEIYLKISKYDANKKKAKTWIINSKTIYGLYQEDTIKVGYKWLEPSFIPYINGVLLIKAINGFWVYF